MATPAPTAQHWVLRLCFVSGLSGILFEVLWTRIFAYLLGGTTHSVTAVITAFMLGLGLGSYLLGRAADRSGAAGPAARSVTWACARCRI